MVRPDPLIHRSSHIYKPTIKFLCSYGGKILPRYPDGKLRYLGGETRLLSVHRSISFPELLLKLGELCGTCVSLSLRCQLPSEDLDALISITSDEDLANLIEEYDRSSAASSSSSPTMMSTTTTTTPPSSPSLKIRAFLSSPNYVKRIVPSPPSFSSSPTISSSNLSSPRISTMPPVAHRCCYRQISSPNASYLENSGSAIFNPLGVYSYQHGNFIHNGNHWQ